MACPWSTGISRGKKACLHNESGAGKRRWARVMGEKKRNQAVWLQEALWPWARVGGAEGARRNWAVGKCRQIGAITCLGCQLGCKKGGHIRRTEANKRNRKSLCKGVMETTDRCAILSWKQGRQPTVLAAPARTCQRFQGDSGRGLRPASHDGAAAGVCCWSVPVLVLLQLTGASHRLQPLGNLRHAAAGRSVGWGWATGRVAAEQRWASCCCAARQPDSIRTIAQGAGRGRQVSDTMQPCSRPAHPPGSQVAVGGQAVGHQLLQAVGQLRADGATIAGCHLL